MTWFRMDDSWGTHPKVQACSPLARLLWVYGGLYCAQHLTDGTIPKATTPLLLASSGAARKHPAELVAAGLWDDDGDAYTVRSWHEYQPSRDDVEAVKEKRRAAGVEANHKRWHVAKGVTSKSCPHCATDTDPNTDRSTDDERTLDGLPPSSSRPHPPTTKGFTNNSSSSDYPTDDDDLATRLGVEDYERAVAAGVHIGNHARYRARCIDNRRAELAQPLLPADAPPIQPDGFDRDAHADCPWCDGKGDRWNADGAWLGHCTGTQPQENT